MKIVLDTNVLIQVISARNLHHWIWISIQSGDLTLCITTDILDEYHEIITEYYKNANFADAVLKTILELENTVKTEKYFFLGLPNGDEDDQKFVDCCFASGAQYLVTEDKVFFKELRTDVFPFIHVIKPEEFRKIFQVI